MFEDFASKLANVLTDYSTGVHKGDCVLIASGTLGAPVVEAVLEATLRRGAYPITSLHLPHEYEIWLRAASDDQMAWPDPVFSKAHEVADVTIQVLAPHHIRTGASYPPERLAKFFTRQSSVFEQIILPRRNAGLQRWVLTQWPTDALAQDANMSPQAYQEFMYRAGGLDHDDPAAYWQSISQRQAQMIGWMEGKSQVQIHGPGVDLTFDISGRHWINADGHQNFPDGEILTSPIEESVNGTITFNLPLSGDHEVQGIQLVFKNGRVTETRAEKEEAYLLSLLDTDEGARRIGLFGIGTNPNIPRSTGSWITTGKIAGIITLNMGQAIAAETGGKNKSKAYWRMPHDLKEGEIRVDGKTFFKNGEFMV